MLIRVRNKKIGDKAPVFIIAELGVNHNGDPRLALRMVEAVARAGADAVKLQVVNPDESYAAESASYKIFKKACLDFNTLKKIKKAAEEKGLIFFATPGDLSSLATLLKLKIPLIKISSGCMTNVSLLRKAAKTGLPIIVSTGMSYMQEVKKTIKELERNGAKEIVFLHCVSHYPAAYEELNLNSIKTLQSQFKYPIGFSDHTQDNLASLVAVSMGAKVIEKHFTLNKRLKGPDQRFSADPEGLKCLVDNIRNIEKMTGSYMKRPTAIEKKLKDEMRRFLVFTKDLSKGVIIKEDDIAAKRLIKGKGLPPKYYDRVIGRRISGNAKRDDLVKLNLLK